MPGVLRPGGWFGGWRGERTEGWRARPLVVGAVAGAVIVVVLGSVAAGLALSSGSNPGASAARTHHGAGAAGRSGSSAPKTGPAGGSGSATSPTSSTGSTAGQAPAASSATSAPATPGGAVQIASISPGGGAAGQSVVLSGSGFYSSSGVVTAYFGGTAAPTSCTSQASCTVTVPDLGPSPSSVAVTLVTSAGRSNPVAFSYQ